MGEILKYVEALYKGVCSSTGAVSWRRKGERANRDEPDTERWSRITGIAALELGVLVES